eukprot:1804140-Rhodomonas_salina.1
MQSEPCSMLLATAAGRSFLFRSFFAAMQDLLEVGGGDAAGARDVVLLELVAPRLHVQPSRQRLVRVARQHRAAHLHAAQVDRAAEQLGAALLSMARQRHAR